MDLLVVSPEEKEKILQFYNVTNSQLSENIELIKTWKIKVPHLPDISDDLIEKLLIRNKFQVERTKRKIDNYFTIRGTQKAFYQDFETTTPSKEATYYLPSTRLTPNLERVILWKVRDLDADHFDFNRLVKAQLAIEELCMQYDYSIGIRYLADLEGFSFKHFLKVNPLTFSKLMTFGEHVYSNRIVGMDIINAPPFVAKLVALFKVVMKPKIHERIVIHENLDSLYEVIPRECLANEFGGTAGHLEDLLYKWDNLIKNHYDFFINNYENVSREDLRPPDMKYEPFGIDGTFRQLTID